VWWNFEIFTWKIIFVCLDDWRKKTDWTGFFSGWVGKFRAYQNDYHVARSHFNEISHSNHPHKQKLFSNRNFKISSQNSLTRTHKKSAITSNNATNCVLFWITTFFHVTMIWSAFKNGFLRSNHASSSALSYVRLQQCTVLHCQLDNNNRKQSKKKRVTFASDNDSMMMFVHELFQILSGLFRRS
jgi:hypothetical protein